MRFVALSALLFARLAWAGSVGVGDRLPGLALQGWDGKAIVLSGLAGKTVVVDFWASWCVTCRLALPALDRLARQQPADKVVVLAVNIDRDRSAADAWLAERLPDRAVTLATDPEGTALARFGAAGMPAVYVAGPDGVVRFAESGYAPERVEAVGRAIAAIGAPARD
jgi:thiol-disulfide isomerase/thioredoxin